MPGASYGHLPYGITAGPDGALWFTELQGEKIGRITTAGVITEYPLPTPNAAPYEITTGPDGALWFTEFNVGQIGRITTSGLVTEYSVGYVCCSTDPTDIVAGPDGGLWFTNLNSGWIGRMSTQGEVTRYPLPILSPDYGIALGPDNAFWFTGGIGTGAVIWRITTDGIFSMFNVPTKDAGLTYITLGPDNALWFTEQWPRQIGRVTTRGVFTEYSAGMAGGAPEAITGGTDGAVWFGKLGYIGQIVLSDKTPPVITMQVTPSVLSPPLGQVIPVTVSGTITDTNSGIDTSNLRFAVIDEYRQVQPTGPILPDSAGNYSFTVPLVAWRNANDPDGRRYAIQVSAKDKAGNRAVRSAIIRVP